MGLIPPDPPIDLSARSYPTPIDIGNIAWRGAVLVRHGKTVEKHDEEVDMVRHFTAALAELPAPERDVLLYAQLTLRQRAPRNKLTPLPSRLGR